MQIKYHGFILEINLEYSKNQNWMKIPHVEMEFENEGEYSSDKDQIKEQSYQTEEKDATYFFQLEQNANNDFLNYHMGFQSTYPTQLRMNVSVVGEEDIFHVIPCNIYGNNNADTAHTDEFPLLTYEHTESVFCSPRWEYRADRAATPVSAICTRNGCVGVTVDPYAKDGEKEVHNGLFVELSNICGCSLGYTNDPITFTLKRTPDVSTYETALNSETQGRIYAVPTENKNFSRTAIHKIIRSEYEKIHQRATYKKSFKDAVEGCFNSFVKISWDSDAKEYTNCNCLPPQNTILKPWRNVVEIGWTGGGVLAYPFILADFILDEDTKKAIKNARSGYEMIDRIINGYNEESGMINDLTVPIDESGSRVNGWWSGFGLTKDNHCSYNVGSAVHYILKSIYFLKKMNKSYPDEWLETCVKVIDTVVMLQREDGAYGYTYDIHSKKVTDWEGFAGCWFVPCAAYLYHFTGERKYLESASKALTYYEHQVGNICCCGTPMDTWKSVDEEGNLAFIRGSRLLHEFTGDSRYLEALKLGADYEFLWRYSYPTHPDYRPIKEGWNACGGSVTSVSNPHIHPMGMIIDTDLYYLGKQLKDQYYTERAEDGTAWIMQTLELYPKETGYGQYGVLSERWCPSDGLTIQRDSNNRPYSSWFSFNLWAGAAAFEEACERELGIE